MSLRDAPIPCCSPSASLLPSSFTSPSASCCAPPRVWPHITFSSRYAARIADLEARIASEKKRAGDLGDESVYRAHYKGAKPYKEIQGARPRHNEVALRAPPPYGPRSASALACFRMTPCVHLLPSRLLQCRWRARGPPRCRPWTPTRSSAQAAPPTPR